VSPYVCVRRHDSQVRNHWNQSVDENKWFVSTSLFVRVNVISIPSHGTGELVLESVVENSYG